MARQSLFTKKELFALAGDTLAKDKLIYDRLGIDSQSLNSLRSLPDADALLSACELIGRKASPTDVTHLGLAALLYGSWDRPASKSSAVYEALQPLYGPAVQRRIDEFGVKPSAIQCLREQVLGYQGNLYEAKLRWPSIEISEMDLSRNIKLPLVISRAEAYLLGVIWADGFISGQPGHHTLKLIGNEKDFPFYENIVAPRVSDLFGAQVQVSKQKQALGPVSELNSFVVNSWLKNELGFPVPKDNIKIPNLDWTSELEHGFLSGVFDAMGNINFSTNSARLSINECDQTFFDEIAALCQKEAFNPKNAGLLSTGSRRLTLHSDDVQLAYLRGMLTNPAWSDRLENIWGRPASKRE